MTQEEKELLLIDLCGRLPYEVIVGYSTKDNPNILDKIGRVIYVDIRFGMIQMQSESGTSYGLPPSEFIKPYLRPMSSMTEEEKEELKSKCLHTETEEDWDGVRCDVWGIQILDKYDTRRWDNPIWPSTINMDAIDWLNKNHFDYRGFIEKGLAIEAAEGMYNLK